MKIVTIRDINKVAFGAPVKEIDLGGVIVPACTIGQPGRGRHMEILPVRGEVPSDGVLRHARVEHDGKRYILIPISEDEDDGGYVVFVHTPRGFRGDGDFTGVKLQWYCPRSTCGAWGDLPVPPACPNCGDPAGERGPRPTYASPPKPILIGFSADGDAGRMGSSREGVWVVPPGEVLELRIKAYGRRYGLPHELYLRVGGPTDFPILVDWEHRDLV